MIEDNITDITTAPAEQPVPIIDEQTQQVDAPVTPDAPPPVEPEKPAVVLKDIDFFNNNVDWHNSNLAEGEKPLKKYKFAQDIPDEEYNGLKSKVEVGTLNEYNTLSTKYPEYKVGKAEKYEDINDENYTKLHNANKAESELTQYNEIVRQLPNKRGLIKIKDRKDLTPELLGKAKSAAVEDLNADMAKKSKLLGVEFKPFESYEKIDWDSVGNTYKLSSVKTANKSLSKLKEVYGDISPEIKKLPEFSSYEDFEKRKGDLVSLEKSASATKSKAEQNKFLETVNNQVASVNKELGANIPIYTDFQTAVSAFKPAKDGTIPFNKKVEEIQTTKGLEDFRNQISSIQPTGGARGDITAPNLATDNSPFNLEQKRKEYLAKYNERANNIAMLSKKTLKTGDNAPIFTDEDVALTSPYIKMAPMRPSPSVDANWLNREGKFGLGAPNIKMDEVSGRPIDPRVDELSELVSKTNKRSNELSVTLKSKVAEYNDYAKEIEGIQKSGVAITPNQKLHLDNLKEDVDNLRLGLDAMSSSAVSKYNNLFSIKKTQGSTAGDILRIAAGLPTELLKVIIQSMSTAAPYFTKDFSQKESADVNKWLDKKASSLIQAISQSSPEHLQSAGTFMKGLDFSASMVPYILGGEVELGAKVTASEVLMLMSSFQSELEQLNNNAKTENLSQNEKNGIALSHAVVSTAAMTLGLKAGIKGKGNLGMSIENMTYNVFKNMPTTMSGVRTILSSALAGGSSFAGLNFASSIAGEGVNKAVNLAKGEELFPTKNAYQIVGHALESAGEGLFNGAFFGGITGIVAAVNQGVLNSSVFNAVDEMYNNPAAFNVAHNEIRRKLALGEITPKEAATQFKSITVFKDIMSQIPEDLNKADRYAVTKLLLENKKYEAQMSGLNESFAAQFKKRIENNNKEIEKIAASHIERTLSEKEAPTTEEGKPTAEATPVEPTEEQKAARGRVDDFVEELATSNPDAHERAKEDPAPVIDELIESSKEKLDAAEPEEKAPIQEEIDRLEGIKKDVELGNEKPVEEQEAKPLGEVSDSEHTEFIDTGKVDPKRLEDIANKVKNNEPLSDREKDIFTNKTAEVNNLIREQAEPKAKDTDPGGAKFTPELEAQMPQHKPMFNALNKGLAAIKSIMPNIDVRIHDTHEGMQNVLDVYDVKGKDGKRLRAENTKGNYAVFPNGGIRIDLNLAAGANRITAAHEIGHVILEKAFGDSPKMFDYLKRQVSSLVGETKNKYLLDFIKNYGESSKSNEYLTELAAIMRGGKIEPTVMRKVAAAINKIISKVTGGRFSPFEDIKNSNELVSYFSSLSEALHAGKEIKLNEKYTPKEEPVSEKAANEKPKSTQQLKDEDEKAKGIADKTISLVKKGGNQPTMIIKGKKDGKDYIDANDTSMKNLREKKPVMYINRAIEFAKSTLVKGNVRKYNSGASIEQKLKWADSVYSKAKETVVSNLLHLYDNIPQHIRDISKLWYDGANKIANDFSQKYNISHEQSAAIIATLSPQKPWFDNLHIAHFLMDFDVNNQNTKLTNDVYDFYKRTGADYPEQVLHLEELSKEIGKKYSELSDYDKSIMIRHAFDTNYDRRAPTRTPTGHIVGREKSMSSYSGYDKIANAVSIMKDGSSKNISDNIGADSKVRNFYNNIIDPASDKYITIDTHAIAAGYHLPLGSKSEEVNFDFGTYSFFHDAYTEAAKQRGILPREMQSITWEGVKSLFPPETKVGKNKDIARDLQQKYKNGELSIKQVQKQIKENGKDLSKTSWSGYLDKDAAERESGGYINELSLIGGDKNSDRQGGSGSVIGEVPGVGEGSEVSDRVIKSKQSLVDDAKMTKDMTEDEKGNYLFYHYSPGKIPNIDPRHFGKNLRTGRDERPGIGVSMYYTRPDRRDVGGSYGYVVRVPKDKVYPFNSDPLNLMDKAKATFEKMYPGQAFDKNKQVAFVSQEAAKAGYDMTVAKWGNDLRAQTTKVMKGETYEKPHPDYHTSTVFNPKLEKYVANENKPKSKQQVDAYHGSPHDFDEFKMEKIGTGEGAQAFGHGLYFTDLKRIGEEYAKKLSLNKKYSFEGIDNINNIATHPMTKAFIQDMLKSDPKNRTDAINWVRENSKGKSEKVISELMGFAKLLNIDNSVKGNLYNVTLHEGKTPEQYTWLEWDKPLNIKLLSKIKNDFKANRDNFKKTENYNQSDKYLREYYDGLLKKIEAVKIPSNSDLYKRLSVLFGSDKQASSFLLENGIDGVKYPAESIARGATSENARGFNYVVFDEKAVTIKAKSKQQLTFGDKTNIQGVDVTIPDEKEQEALKAERTKKRYFDESVSKMKTSGLSKDQVKKLLDGDNMAILTGTNPDGNAVSDKTNKLLNQKAEKWLQDNGYKYHEVTGKYGQTESSFLVEGMTADRALEFAKEFKQDSVAHSEGLIYSDNTIEKRDVNDDAFDVDVTDPEADFVSAIKTNDGKTLGLKIGIDFSERGEYKPKSKQQLSSDDIRDNMDKMFEDYSKKMKGRPVEEVVNRVIDEVQHNWVKEGQEIDLENAIRSFKEDNGIKVKTPPSQAKISGEKPKKITVTERTALKDQIKLEIKAARDATKTAAGERKAIGDKLNEMVDGGKITANQAKALLNRFANVNTANPDMVDRYLDYAEKVFNDADYADKLNEAREINKKVKKAIKSREVQLDLRMATKKFTDANVTKVEDIDAHLEMGRRLLDATSSSGIGIKEGEISDRTRKAINIKELSDYTDEVAQKIAETDEANLLEATGIDVKSEEPDTVAPSIEDYIRDRFNAMADSIRSMIKSGISPIDGEKYDLSDEDKIKLSKLVKMTADDIVDPKDKIRALEAMDHLLTNGIMGRIPYILNKIKMSKDVDRGINERVRVTSGKVGLLAIENAVQGIRKILSFSGNSKFYHALLRNSTRRIDNVIKNYKGFEIFNNGIKQIAQGESSYKTDLNTMNSDKLKNELVKGMGGDFNRVIESGFKMTMYLRQLEHESNPGSKKSPPAMAFVEKTIEASMSGKHPMNEKSAKLLKKLSELYSTDGNIDSKKIWDSFSPAEKKVVEGLRKLYDTLTPYAQKVASEIHDQPFDPFENYTTIVTQNTSRGAEQVLNEKGKLNAAIGITPAGSIKTKAGQIEERTGQASAINFDPFSSANKAVRNVMLDYHMTLPLRTMSKITDGFIAKSLEMYKADPSKENESRLLFAKAMRKTFEDVLEATLSRSFFHRDIWSDVKDYVSRASTTYMLSNPSKSASEAISNLSYVVPNYPEEMALGITEYKDYSLNGVGGEIMRNVNSYATDRAYPHGTLSGAFLSPESYEISTNDMQNIRGFAVNAATKAYYNSLMAPQKGLRAVSETMLTAPDLAIIRPLWFGSMAKSFKKLTGQNIDFEAIAKNDVNYLDKFEDAINKSRDIADKNVTDTGAAKNPWLMSPITVKRHGTLLGQTQNYLANYSRNEYEITTDAIIAMHRGGKISRADAAKQISGVLLRAGTYTAIRGVIASGLAAAGIAMHHFLYDDDDKDELTQAITEGKPDSKETRKIAAKNQINFLTKTSPRIPGIDPSIDLNNVMMTSDKNKFTMKELQERASDENTFSDNFIKGVGGFVAQGVLGRNFGNIQNKFFTSTAVEYLNAKYLHPDDYNRYKNNILYSSWPDFNKNDAYQKTIEAAVGPYGKASSAAWAVGTSINDYLESQSKIKAIDENLRKIDSGEKVPFEQSGLDYRDKLIKEKNKLIKDNKKNVPAYFRDAIISGLATMGTLPGAKDFENVMTKAMKPTMVELSDYDELKEKYKFYKGSVKGTIWGTPGEKDDIESEYYKMTHAGFDLTPEGWIKK